MSPPRRPLGRPVIRPPLAPRGPSCPLVPSLTLPRILTISESARLVDSHNMAQKQGLTGFHRLWYGSPVSRKADRTTGPHQSGASRKGRATRQLHTRLVGYRAQPTCGTTGATRRGQDLVRRARLHAPPLMLHRVHSGLPFLWRPTLPGTRDTRDVRRRAADGEKRETGRGWTIPASPTGPSLMTNTLSCPTTRPGHTLTTVRSVQSVCAS